MINTDTIQELCTGCGACESACANQAISLSHDTEGFFYPDVDVDKCTGCGLCDRVCPLFQAESEERRAERKMERFRRPVMLQARSLEVLRQSSSGGAFSLLAAPVLASGGHVWGARYDFQEERLIYDDAADCGIEPLRKSKYIEAHTGDMCRRIAAQLRAGDRVMAVATPCHLEGLLSYLTANRVPVDNLLAVRFVCHGVPSNLLFNACKHYEEKRRRARMTAFDFRPKEKGWRSQQWHCEYDNGRSHECHYKESYFYNLFYEPQCAVMRKSCYSCRRILDNNADLTIADFWAVERFCQSADPTYGVSLVTAHTSAGLGALQALAGEECDLRELPAEAIAHYQGETDARTGMRPMRDNFMAEVRQKGYIAAVLARKKKEIDRIILKRRIRTILKKLHIL